MTIKQLIECMPVARQEGDLEREAGGLAYDSRQVKKGDVFFAIPGFVQDGHRYIPMAVSAGAAAVVCERDVPVGGGAAKIIVPSARAALADAAAAFFAHPSRRFRLVGITGTNGKTTIAYLLESVLRASGMATALSGTIETRIRGRSMPQRLTTPESYDLQRNFAAMAEAGVQAVVMEVSSHALALERVRGSEFDCAVFSNFSQDHLDFHGRMGNYRDSKLALFRSLGLGSKKETAGIINLDDAEAAAFCAATPGSRITYALDREADVRGKITGLSPERLALSIDCQGRVLELQSDLAAPFNAPNILAACACALYFRISLEAIQAGIEAVKDIPGRMQKIDLGQGFRVLVDFAHTPDSLEKALAAVAAFTSGRIILVFGCPGNHDRSKRAIMGAIAARAAGYTILTSDDPYDEDPEAILDEVESGMASVADRPKAYRRIADRRCAIRAAVRMAGKGDTVLIAGRGHEKFQEVKGTQRELDDVAEAEQALCAALS